MAPHVTFGGIPGSFLHLFPPRLFQITHHTPKPSPRLPAGPPPPTSPRAPSPNATPQGAPQRLAAPPKRFGRSQRDLNEAASAASAPQRSVGGRGGPTASSRHHLRHHLRQACRQPSGEAGTAQGAWWYHYENLKACLIVYAWHEHNITGAGGGSGGGCCEKGRLLEVLSVASVALQ